MNALSSSFLPTLHPFNVSSIPTYYTNSQTMITENSLITTKFIGPIKNLLADSFEPMPQKVIPRGKSTKQFSLKTTFKSIDDFITNSLDHLPLRPSIDPKHVLSGNLTPVDELPPTPCEVVEGSLPSCLDGVYIRNGPNPQFIPHGPYHLFDGDGMLHMIKISKGEVTFCSRYVKTYKYEVERDMGHPVFPSAFSSFNGLIASLSRIGLSVARVLAGHFNPVAHGFGLANTSVAQFGGKLFALGELDLPYEIKVTLDGDIVTVGRHDFDSGEPVLSMTAHPKVDQETGEAFAFRYNITPPLLTLFRIDPDGIKQPDVGIFSMNDTSLSHDFAVTKNHVIIPDLQMVMSPFQVLKGRPPMRVDNVKVPRLGVIRKYAKDDSEMWWINVPGFNMLHAVNAWEEDDGQTIVLVASNLSSVDQVLESIASTDLRMEEVRISVKEKKLLLRRPLSSHILDMAVINQAYASKKTRYVYSAIVAKPNMLVGVVKLDLSLRTDDHPQDCTVASRIYGPGCSGSEPFFVPREPNNLNADEDDGYLIAYVHDEMNTQESRFLVMDAKSPTLETVVAVELPGRVPTGFHGLFLSESRLKKL